MSSFAAANNAVGVSYEEDEVVSEMDVYVTDNSELNLYLMQYPLKSADALPSVLGSETVVGAKIKPNQVKIEVNTEVQVPPQVQSQQQYGYEQQRQGSSSVRSLTHSSSAVKSSMTLAVGVVRDNALHLTKLQDKVVQMRPSVLRKEEELVPVPTSRQQQRQQDASSSSSSTQQQQSQQAAPAPLTSVSNATAAATGGSYNSSGGGGGGRHFSYLQYVAGAEQEKFRKLNVYPQETVEADECFEKLVFDEARAAARRTAGAEGGVRDDSVGAAVPLK